MVKELIKDESFVKEMAKTFLAANKKVIKQEPEDSGASTLHEYEESGMEGFLSKAISLLIIRLLLTMNFLHVGILRCLLRTKIMMIMVLYICRLYIVTWLNGSVEH